MSNIDLSIKIIQLNFLVYKFPEVRGGNHCEIVFALKILAKTDRVLFTKIWPPEYSLFFHALEKKIILRIKFRNNNSMKNILFH